MLCRSLIDARQGRAGQGRAGAGSWRAALTERHGLLEHKRRKLPKSAALKVWIRMAISRLGRTAVAASGLAALAAVVIWFGILARAPEPRRSPPAGETSRGADSSTPEAQPAPAATAPPAETRRAEPSVPAAAPGPASPAEQPAAAAREAPVAPSLGRADGRERDRRTGPGRDRRTA